MIINCWLNQTDASCEQTITGCVEKSAIPNELYWSVYAVFALQTEYVPHLLVIRCCICTQYNYISVLFTSALFLKTLLGMYCTNPSLSRVGIHVHSVLCTV